MNNIEINEYFSVLIPDGESPQALGVLRCLGQIKNIKVYVLSNNPWASARFSRYTSRFFSYEDKKTNVGRLNEIHKIVKEMKVDIILPVDGKTLQLFCTNREIVLEMGSVAPFPKSDAFEIANNKWLLAEWLKSNQIPHPSTILYQTNSTFEEDLSCMSFPVLIKPVIGGNGNGIRIFNTPAALNSFCKQHVHSGEFIVQSFIDGHDIDCSVLCQEGKILAYTIQKGFINSSRQFGPPAGIDFLYDQTTYEVVRELVEKFNWSGVVHIDLRYDKQDKQVKVIEMNPRFWSSVIGSLCAGINFPYLACLAGLNHDISKNEPQIKRFVNGRVAIKILAQRLVLKKRKDLYFDNSIIEFLLRDPLPTLVGKFSKIYNKIVSKK